MTRNQHIRLALRHLTTTFGFTTETEVENSHRMTGSAGKFHACRIRSVVSGKVVIDVGGAPSSEEAQRLAFEAFLIQIGEFCKTLPKPIDFDRKEWLRKNMVRGGKD